MSVRKCGFIVCLFAGLAEAAVMREHEGSLRTSNGSPVRGPVDLEILLYRNAEGGDPLLPTPLTFNRVSLNDGKFRIRIELSDADSLIAFGARGDAEVWVQILDQMNDRVYPRQLVTGSAEVITAITPPVDPNTTKLGDTPLALLTSTDTGTATATDLEPMLYHATHSLHTLEPQYTSVLTAIEINTATNHAAASNTATSTSTYDRDPASEHHTIVELSRATFIESPLSLDPTQGRAELGRAGRCSGTPEIGGEVIFNAPFRSRPYIFLTPGDGEQDSCIPRIIYRSHVSFAWSSGAGRGSLGGCSCIEWMAVGP